jgi:hypothetical protein
MTSGREIVGKKVCRRKETTVKKHSTCMQEGGDSWKEAMNTCGEGRPNDSRVRVFVRFLCKWLKSPIDINIDTKVS